MAILTVGDFVLSFLDEVVASDIAYVGTCNELNAAYAADGYAPESCTDKNSPAGL
jgi:TPP-dependent 2-oxoacid decarboxylase